MTNETTNPTTDAGHCANCHGTVLDVGWPGACPSCGGTPTLTLREALTPPGIDDEPDEPVRHAERLTEQGRPTGYALCDRADGTFPGGPLVTNAGMATCEACVAILNGDAPHPGDGEDEAVASGQFVEKVRRLLADHESARVALNRARAHFESIGRELADLRIDNPVAYAAAREAAAEDAR